MSMPEVWIELSDTERRRDWRWTGFLTLVLSGGAVAIGLAEPTPDRWWWVGVCGLAWVASAFHMINRSYGRTRLTADGMEFRTLVSRRSVHWSEITRLEKRQHLTRSGSWCELRVVRGRGRSLTIPGAFTNRTRDAEFERKLSVIQEHWSRANVARRH